MESESLLMSQLAAMNATVLDVKDGPFEMSADGMFYIDGEKIALTPLSDDEYFKLVLLMWAGTNTEAH